MTNYTFQNLISTVNKDGQSLIRKMNLENDAILINQLSKHSFETYQINNNTIEEYGFNEKGVGLSRNSALMRSNADICLMSDDDMIYVDNYSTIINEEYKKNPDADMILFNVRVHDKQGEREIVYQNGRVHYLNSLKYGTVNFTFKRNKILKNNIYFSLLFGGGSKYSNGEDSLFLWDCLKSGLKIYSSTKIIADVYNYESSWFKGYNEQFFLDRGALFEALSPNFSLLLIYQYALRKRNKFEGKYSVNEVMSLMKKGRTLYKKI